MNVLKALAKMTKIASGLQDNWDHTLRELATFEEKYDDTVKVATDRDTRIKQLEAELYAAVAKASAPVNQMEKGFGILKEMGYVWEPSLGVWLEPPQAPTAPTLDVNWDSEPWATHLLSSKGQQVFAELVGGEYLGVPETDVGHGRLCYVVSLAPMAFQVIATHPDYAGPRTRGVDVDSAALGCTPVTWDDAVCYPSKPEGIGWRSGSKPPRDMGAQVELVFTDGVGPQSRSAESVEWGVVAWWRFA